MKKPFRLFPVLLWLVAVGCGTVALMVYSYIPGRDEPAPKSWVASSGLTRDAELPTLIMFAHPKCPCTRASIGELDSLMTRCQGKVKVEVVFYRPKGAKEDWAHTDLWRSAAAIPGVKVREDEDGREASRFQAATSGHVVLYDPKGRLLFSGGITESRGHSGDNEGRDAIVELVEHGTSPKHSTPTFGCSLANLKAPGVAMEEASCTP